jgi:hypothetical protein
MTQYKQLITGGLQMFSVHYGSILHLKINILIYISSFPCPSLNRQRHDRNEKIPSFASGSPVFHLPNFVV